MTSSLALLQRRRTFAARARRPASSCSNSSSTFDDASQRFRRMSGAAGTARAMRPTPRSRHAAFGSKAGLRPRHAAAAADGSSSVSVTRIQARAREDPPPTTNTDFPARQRPHLRGCATPAPTRFHLSASGPRLRGFRARDAGRVSPPPNNTSQAVPAAHRIASLRAFPWLPQPLPAPSGPWLQAAAPHTHHTAPPTPPPHRPTLPQPPSSAPNAPVMRRAGPGRLPTGPVGRAHQTALSRGGGRRGPRPQGRVGRPERARPGRVRAGPVRVRPCSRGGPTRRTARR